MVSYENHITNEFILFMKRAWVGFLAALAASNAPDMPVIDLSAPKFNEVDSEEAFINEDPSRDDETGWTVPDHVIKFDTSDYGVLARLKVYFKEDMHLEFAVPETLEGYPPQSEIDSALQSPDFSAREASHRFNMGMILVAQALSGLPVPRMLKADLEPYIVEALEEMESVDIVPGDIDVIKGIRVVLKAALRVRPRDFLTEDELVTFESFIYHALILSSPGAIVIPDSFTDDAERRLRDAPGVLIQIAKLHRQDNWYVWYIAWISFEVSALIMLVLLTLFCCSGRV